MLKRGSCEADVNTYKQYRNIFNRTKRAAMQLYYTQKAEAFKKNTKELWKLINSTISKQKNNGSIIPYITVDRLRVTNGQNIADSFAKHYAEIGANLASQIGKGSKGITDYLDAIPRLLNSITLEVVTCNEIDKEIDNLPNKMSSRCNTISNMLLKSLKTSIIYPLPIIFSQSLQSGTFPEKIQEAEVVSLYKNKERDKVINYCPISFLMTVSKLLKKLMYKHVYQFLIKYDVLYQSQYGFRKHHSCEQAIQELIGKILHAREDGLQSASIFLDLSKAFNTLDHVVLLSKLERNGIRGTVLDWFRSYLSGHSLRTKVPVAANKIYYSKKYDINYGTAQGSCLGPLLSIIFCNDIHLLPLIGDPILFADDTTLFNKQKNKVYWNFQRYMIWRF